LHIASALPDALLLELDEYIAHGERQSDQVRRRLLRGERIPHAGATRGRACIYQGKQRSGVLPPVPYRAVRRG
jgi:hypothetical protein